MITEMIHTASLVHDDVIDASDTRRGKASVNKHWGQKRVSVTQEQGGFRLVVNALDHKGEKVLGKCTDLNAEKQGLAACLPALPGFGFV